MPVFTLAYDRCDIELVAESLKDAILEVRKSYERWQDNGSVPHWQEIGEAWCDDVKVDYKVVSDTVSEIEKAPRDP